MAAHAQSGPAKGPSGHLSEEGAALYHQGVGLVLARWTALQLAIHNEWGGPSSHLKAQQLHNDIFHWMLQSKAPRYIDELEDFLDENLLQQFNTETEDGSLEEVAEKLMSIYEECLEGNFETINELIAANNSVASQSTLKSKQMEADNVEENANRTMVTANKDVDSMDMDDDGFQAAVEGVGNSDNSLPLGEDADGWQVVSSKSKRKPRKL